MNPIHYLLPPKTGLVFQTLQFDEMNHQLIVSLRSRRIKARCPHCATPSQRVHSYYYRKVSDLPWADCHVIFQLALRKLRCRNETCARRIFCERLSPAWLAPRARKTRRLSYQQCQLGLALGGAAGARLSQQLNLDVSATTLLRLIRSMPLEETPPPRVLGVDDFAKRKGCHYGTILVDLERCRPIGLLPDRQGQTLANGLKAHPGVEIISRDRASAYADGAREGAPEAIQVADRFHLVRNFSDALLPVFEHHRPTLKTLFPALATNPFVSTLHDAAIFCEEKETGAPSPATAWVAPSPRSALSLTRQAQAQQDYQQAKELHRQGWTISAIADQLKRNRKTVRRYLQADTFPEKHRPAGILDPYKPYLLRRWNEGCRTGIVLVSEIEQQGYRGSRSTVLAYLSRLRRAQGLAPRSRALYPAAPVSDIDTATLTPRQAVGLVLQRPDKQDEKDKVQRDELSQAHPDIQQAIRLSDDFLQMLRQRQAEAFDHWLEQMTACPLSSFRNFAKSLRSDYEAVKAGLSLSWSTGPVEGQINRLKMLKRQMFGRAKLDLLEKRLLYAP